ncbi:hypothetical protein, partial [Enterobacter hormaechei]|uniref:hypothetical protein n=1 Tax=Enterobacter hormaechei TaxID=158836 RepID=UPI0019530F33
QREGFDIRVYDAESGEDKSVTAMSGGERVWISCRNRHEIHYAENWIMPNPTLDQQSTVCDCPPNFCREARHKTARAAAFTSG